MHKSSFTRPAWCLVDSALCCQMGGLKSDHWLNLLLGRLLGPLNGRKTVHLICSLLRLKRKHWEEMGHISRVRAGDYFIFIEGNCHTSGAEIEEEIFKIFRKIKQKIFGKHASAKVQWNTEEKQGWSKGWHCFQMEKQNRPIHHAEENESKKWQLHDLEHSR